MRAVIWLNILIFAGGLPTHSWAAEKPHLSSADCIDVYDAILKKDAARINRRLRIAMGLAIVGEGSVVAFVDPDKFGNRHAKVEEKKPEKEAAARIAIDPNPPKLRPPRDKKELLKQAHEALKFYKTHHQLPPDLGEFFVESELVDDFSVSSDDKPFKLFQNLRKYQEDKTVLKGKEIKTARRYLLKYLKKFCADKSQMTDFYSYDCGNRTAESKLIAAVDNSPSPTLLPGFTFGIQVFKEEMRPVIFRKNPDEVIDVVTGLKYKGVQSVIFHPAIFYQSYLLTNGEKSDVSEEDLILARPALIEPEKPKAETKPKSEPPKLKEKSVTNHPDPNQPLPPKEKDHASAEDKKTIALGGNDRRSKTSIIEGQPDQNGTTITVDKTLKAVSQNTKDLIVGVAAAGAGLFLAGKEAVRAAITFVPTYEFGTDSEKVSTPEKDPSERRPGDHSVRASNQDGSSGAGLDVPLKFINLPPDASVASTKKDLDRLASVSPVPFFFYFTDPEHLKGPILIFSDKNLARQYNALGSELRYQFLLITYSKAWDTFSGTKKYYNFIQAHLQPNSIYGLSESEYRDLPKIRETLRNEAELINELNIDLFGYGDWEQYQRNREQELNRNYYNGENRLSSIATPQESPRSYLRVIRWNEFLSPWRTGVENAGKKYFEVLEESGDSLVITVDRLSAAQKDRFFDWYRKVQETYGQDGLTERIATYLAKTKVTVLNPGEETGIKPGPNAISFTVLPQMSQPTHFTPQSEKTKTSPKAAKGESATIYLEPETALNFIALQSSEATEKTYLSTLSEIWNPTIISLYRKRYLGNPVYDSGMIKLITSSEHIQKFYKDDYKRKYSNLKMVEAIPRYNHLSKRHDFDSDLSYDKKIGPLPLEEVQLLQSIMDKKWGKGVVTFEIESAGQ